MIRGVARFVVAFSTIALRLSAFIFLRWIPSHVLWPPVVGFWTTFVLSFILLLYLDLEPSERVIEVDTTDIVEVVGNGPEKTILETEIDVVKVETSKDERSVSWMETIYLGIPNASPLISLGTITINAALLLMTLDLTFRTHLFYPVNDLTFHRPVPTSPYTTNIFIRSPDVRPMRVYYRPIDNSTWLAGPRAYGFDNNTDFTSVVTLGGLSPNTRYAYAVLPPDADVFSANRSSFGRFETFPPKGRRGRWSFGSSSCIKPNVPYSPFNHPLYMQGLEYLKNDIPILKFFAFLGPSFHELS